MYMYIFLNSQKSLSCQYLQYGDNLAPGITGNNTAITLEKSGNKTCDPYSGGPRNLRTGGRGLGAV